MPNPSSPSALENRPCAPRGGHYCASRAPESLAKIELLIGNLPSWTTDARRRRTSGSIWRRRNTFGRCDRPAASGFAGRARAQQRIVAGEAFQIVLSQELLIDWLLPAEAVYAVLRDINPSPYTIYSRTPESTLVGASPEMLVRVDGRQITYRPIAGMRLRTGDAAGDERAVEELLVDPKERCEHQMLVDLGRNDLGLVAKIGSVRVEIPSTSSSTPTCFTSFSDVIGEMRDDVSSLDVVFGVSGGHADWCAELRAMETIRELEVFPCGVYGGASATSISPERGPGDHYPHSSLPRRNGVVARWRRHRQRQRARCEDDQRLFKARSLLAAVRPYARRKKTNHVTLCWRQSSVGDSSWGGKLYYNPGDSRTVAQQPVRCACPEMNSLKPAFRQLRLLYL